jgi:hypothetical protein
VPKDAAAKSAQPCLTCIKLSGSVPGIHGEFRGQAPRERWRQLNEQPNGQNPFSLGDGRKAHTHLDLQSNYYLSETRAFVYQWGPGISEVK